jgi:hypothetical protein
MAYISPNFQQIDFPSGLSLDQKIEVFADRVKGWQIEIAEKCRHTSQHSGYGVLHIIISYFEMIAKYENGLTENDRSKEFFKKGLRLVFPGLVNHPSGVSDQVLDSLYEGVRCGLYHGGGTVGNIAITWDQKSAMGFSPDGKSILLNPEMIIEVVKAHFDSYVTRLRDAKNPELRERFNRRFDFQG